MAIEKPPIDIITNDLLNPSFETVDPPVEIWRNMIRDPRFNNMHRWARSPRVSYVVLESGLEMTVNSENTIPFLSPTGTFNLFSPGDRVSASYRVRLLEGNGDPAFRIAFWTGSDYIYGEYVEIQSGHDAIVSFEDVEVPEGAGYMTPYLDGGLLDPGVKIQISQPMHTKGPLPPFYFDGETSPDPDLTPAWTGTPNDSP